MSPAIDKTIWRKAVSVQQPQQQKIKYYDKKRSRNRKRKYHWLYYFRISTPQKDIWCGCRNFNNAKLAWEMIKWLNGNQETAEEPVCARGLTLSLCVFLCCKIQNMKQIVYCTSNAFLKGLGFFLLFSSSLPSSPCCCCWCGCFLLFCLPTFISILVYNKSPIHHRKQW